MINDPLWPAHNSAARAFWISQGLPARTASALAEDGVVDLAQLAGMTRHELELTPNIGPSGMAAIDKLLDRLTPPRPGRPGRIMRTENGDMITVIFPLDVIERQLAQAQRLRDQWADNLNRFKATGRGRIRIGEHWESGAEAIARLQGMVDNHIRTIELLEGFRAHYPENDH